MQIEKLTENYIDAVAEIEKQSFSQPRSREALAEELKDVHIRYFAAISEGILCGYIGMRISFCEAYISNVAVKNEYKRSGVGIALVDKAIKFAKEENCERVLLEVRAKNLPAQNLYEKAGFEKLGVRRKMYDAPVEDGFVYEFKL